MAAETLENGPGEAGPDSVPVSGSYLNFIGASFGHALTMAVRRQRLILAAVIGFLPVLIPLAMTVFSKSQFSQDGRSTFVFLAEQGHVNVLAPLFALFFATMLIAEEVEAHTIPYVLTRPMPRFAWVLGKFLAYMAVVCPLLWVSIFLTFSASTTLADLGYDWTQLKLMLNYWLVTAMALLGYGGLTMFLGAATRRPIVIGVILIYAWQRLAMVVPGVIDFLTIQKYTDAMLPVMAAQRGTVAASIVLGEYQKKVFLIGASKSAVILVLLTLVFLGLTTLTARLREYSSAKAVGG